MVLNTFDSGKTGLNAHYLVVNSQCVESCQEAAHLVDLGELGLRPAVGLVVVLDAVQHGSAPPPVRVEVGGRLVNDQTERKQLSVTSKVKTCFAVLPLPRDSQKLTLIRNLEMIKSNSVILGWNQVDVGTTKTAIVD